MVVDSKSRSRGIGPFLAGTLAACIATSALLAGCGGPSLTNQPASTGPSARASTAAAPGAVVLDDFESGDLDGWRSIDSGQGHWFVFSDGAVSPDPAHAAIMAELRVPDPPDGGHAAGTDANGPGTHILYRDVRLEGEVTLRATVYYLSAGPIRNPATLAFDGADENQQFRVDILRPDAPIDSVAVNDVLATLFRTVEGDPTRLEPTDVSLDLTPWTGQTVRIRLAKADNQGALRIAIDEIRFEPTGASSTAQVELLETPEAATAVDLVLERFSEADALAALEATAAERAAADTFSGAVLVGRDGNVLFEGAWGQADRDAGRPNSTETQFRLGSMNKMFTAVATLQLVEDGVLALDEPIGTYLPDYPNDTVAAEVTIRHLLSHTGGTGDIFGPQFDRQRLELREHSDYVELYGSRGPTFEPGTQWVYSNYGFVLLGAIIEAVSDRSYYDYVRERIFEPLGMTATDSLPESENVSLRATGYMRQSMDSGPWQPNTDTLPWRGTAAGGGYSTVRDLFRFAEGLRTGALLSADTLRQATTQQNSVEPYGFGFELRGEGRLRTYGHGGGAPGMNGDLRIFPELGVVVVALSNLDPPVAGYLVDFYVLRMPVE